MSDSIKGCQGSTEAGPVKDQWSQAGWSRSPGQAGYLARRPGQTLSGMARLARASCRLASRLGLQGGGPIRRLGVVPGPQVLQRHGHPGNLVVGRGAVTAAIGHDHAAGRDAIPADSPTPTCVSVMSV